MIFCRSFFVSHLCNAEFAINEKGFAKKIGEFLEQVSKDPAAVNEVHKDYLKKAEALNAPNASQPKEPLQQQSPEKTHVMGGGSM